MLHCWLGARATGMGYKKGAYFDVGSFFVLLGMLGGGGIGKTGQRVVRSIPCCPSVDFDPWVRPSKGKVVLPVTAMA